MQNQTNYMLFQNSGEIDVNAFRLMGASTKDATKIGYFGTGIKYAMACAFRMGIKLRVFSGTKEIKLTLRKTKLNATEFQVVCVNGTPTGITTNTGRDWKPWFVVREFYCNCLDEPNSKIIEANEGDVVGLAGTTRIFLEKSPVLEDIITDRQRYFSFDRYVLHKLEPCSIMPTIDNTEGIVYRKGIRVYTTSRPTMFDYNFSTIPINEAREAGYGEVLQHTVRLWKFFATKEMILSFCQRIKQNNDRQFYEFNLPWDLSSWERFDAMWLAVLRGRTIIPYEYSGRFTKEQDYAGSVTLPLALCKMLNDSFPGELSIKGLALSKDPVSSEGACLPPEKHEQFLIDESFRFFDQIPVTKDMKTIPVEIRHLDEGVLGTIVKEPKTIVLSPLCFTRGKKQVAITMLEEYLHLVSGYQDNTPEFQETILHFAVSAMEEHTQVYL